VRHYCLTFAADNAAYRMRKLLLILVGLSGFAAPLLANDVSGTWMTIDDETGKPRSYIQISIENGVATGKITKILAIKEGENTNPLCTECKGADYNKPVVGLVILRNLKQDDNEWNGGTIMDPNNGKTYKCKIKAENNGQVLRVRGYVGISMLGRTQIWKKFK